jgi:hypothetical protein
MSKAVCTQSGLVQLIDGERGDCHGSCCGAETGEDTVELTGRARRARRWRVEVELQGALKEYRNWMENPEGARNVLRQWHGLVGFITRTQPQQPGECVSYEYPRKMGDGGR